MDPEELIQLAEQMVSVLQEKTSSETAWDEFNADLFAISLACQEDHVQLLTLIEDLEKQVAIAEHDLQEAHLRDQSGFSEDDLWKQRDNLRHRETSLKEEERPLQNMFNEELSKKRETLQSQKESLKKLDADMQRNQMVLALCASTFCMIPSDEGNNRVAGNLVDSKGCVVDTLGFNTEGMDAFEVCEKLWSLCVKS